MSNGQLKVVPAVFVIVVKDGKVLLLRRANTTWLDGWYDLPAGHLEDQEHLKDGAIRELKEEVNLTVKSEDLKLVHLYQNHHHADAPHYGYIFLAKKWSGVPKIMEPDKCDDLKFFSINNLPHKIGPYSKEAIKEMNSDEVTISYHLPGSIKQ